MYIEIPAGEIELYPWQKDVFKAVSGGKNCAIVIHRRAGKDVLCVQLWLLRALTRVGTHLYLFPLVRQAREVIWNGMMFNGKPFLSIIPECLIEKKNEATMEIRLINGSRMVLGGSNNYDGWMGANPVTLIYSEFALHNPMARQYLNPILVQNGGLEIIQSTPRGENHLYEVMEVVKESKSYYTNILGVDKTFDNDGKPLVTEEQIKFASEMGMSKEKIDQEFYVSFMSGNQGAYYTVEMNELLVDKRIRKIEPIPSIPLMLTADLGGVDSTCFLLFQVVGDAINILHMIVSNGKPMKWYLDESEAYRKKHKMHWGNMFMPHDVAQQNQDFYSAESRLMQARKAGWNFLITPKLSVDDGIEAARYALRKTHINTPDCQLFVRALREYQRTYNEATKMYDKKPLHNWCSHIADAYRYLAINYRRFYHVPIQPKNYKTSL